MEGPHDTKCPPPTLSRDFMENIAAAKDREEIIRRVKQAEHLAGAAFYGMVRLRWQWLVSTGGAAADDVEAAKQLVQKELLFLAEGSPARKQFEDQIDACVDGVMRDGVPPPVRFGVIDGGKTDPQR